jgi:hypothetical protein
MVAVKWGGGARMVALELLEITFTVAVLVFGEVVGRSPFLSKAVRLRYATYGGGYTDAKPR